MTGPAQPGGAYRLEKCRSLCFSLARVFICTAGASAQNRVLELDGTNSYVELPPNLLTKIEEVTEVQTLMGRMSASHGHGPAPPTGTLPSASRAPRMDRPDQP